MAHNDQQMALKLLLNGCLLNFSVYQILKLQVLEMSFGFVGWDGIIKEELTPLFIIALDTTSKECPHQEPS